MGLSIFVALCVSATEDCVSSRQHHVSFRKPSGLPIILLCRQKWSAFCSVLTQWEISNMFENWKNYGASLSITSVVAARWREISAIRRSPNYKAAIPSVIALIRDLFIGLSVRREGLCVKACIKCVANYPCDMKEVRFWSYFYVALTTRMPFTCEFINILIKWFDSWFAERKIASQVPFDTSS